MQPRRILVRSPSWVGDSVMATPALRALRAAHPGAEIALEAPPPLEALYRGLSFYDTFLPVARGARELLARQRVLREDVSCAPCHLEVCPTDHRCMTRLTPERAVAAAEELLA